MSRWLSWTSISNHVKLSAPTKHQTPISQGSANWGASRLSNALHIFEEFPLKRNLSVRKVVTAGIVASWILFKVILRAMIVVFTNLKEGCIAVTSKKFANCTDPRSIIENESTKLNRLSKRGPFRRAGVAEARVWCEQCDTAILLRVETGTRKRTSELQVENRLGRRRQKHNILSKRSLPESSHRDTSTCDLSYA